MSEDSNSGLGFTNNDYLTTTLKLHFWIIWHRAGSISRLEIKFSLSFVCRFQLFRGWFLSEITWLSIILLSHLHLGIDQVESRIHVALLKLLCASVFLRLDTLIMLCWMSMLFRLPTRDTLLSWDRRYHHVCPFYSLGHEFHTHLSFSGPFSTVIWSHFSSWMFSTPPDSLASVAHFIDQPHIVSCSCVALVIKLLMHAVVYNIWRERNHRIFRQNSCSMWRPKFTLSKSVKFGKLGKP